MKEQSKKNWKIFKIAFYCKYLKYIYLLNLKCIRLQDKLTTEETKYLRWKDDNIRRKHNYVPFIFNFLKVLADKGKLKELIQIAREKEAQEEQEKAKEDEEKKLKNEKTNI